MSRTVFLAHSISSASPESATEDIARIAREELVKAGWRVLPREREPLAGILARAMHGDGRAMVASNVASIVNSDLILIIAEDYGSPSSVWVEAGIALAARVCGVVIAGPNVALPLLVTSSLGSTSEELPPWHRILVDLFGVSAELRLKFTHQAVHDAIAWADAIVPSPSAAGDLPRDG